MDVSPHVGKGVPGVGEGVSTISTPGVGEGVGFSCREVGKSVRRLVISRKLYRGERVQSFVVREAKDKKNVFIFQRI